jgi:hypothetical protein
MARDHGKNRSAPLVTNLMNIGVANPTITNLDQDVVPPDRSPLKGEWFECGPGLQGGIAVDCSHNISPYRNVEKAYPE